MAKDIQARPASRSVTLKDVAAAAHVHVSTASRALNPATRNMVAHDVAERVITCAHSLGYRVDALAASLRTGRSMLVGVLVPDITNPLFSLILGGINESLHAHGYYTIVADVGGEQQNQIDLVEALIARRVDGLILATAHRNDPVVCHCLERNVPIVLVNRSESTQRAPAAVSDDMLGMKLSVDHLVDLGHRRIAHLGGPQNISTGYLRRLGFEMAMENHGFDRADLTIETAHAYTRQAGHVAGRALLQRHPDITAIATANDLLALGVYSAVEELGRHCPGNISVVGHNDMPLVDMVQPSLTTVRIGHREMGIEAAKLLMRELRQEPGARHNVVLAPSLVTRSSTAKPAPGESWVLRPDATPATSPAG
jgi:LacI family transcriptional regulator